MYPEESPIAEEQNNSKDSDSTGSKTNDKESAFVTLQDKTRIRIGFGSDIGKQREVDEDSIIAMEVATIFESKPKKRVLLVVADGVGGHNKGEVASRMGACITTSTLNQHLIDNDFRSDKYYEKLFESISSANRGILEYSKSNPIYEGMGTTISMAIIDGNELYVANVGDSRVYVINEVDGIFQITKDHTFIQELLDKGEISAEEAKVHPRRHTITRVVGYYGYVMPDIFSLKLDIMDYVVVCCDGLTNHISDEEIKKIVLHSSDSQKASDELIRLANERGGTDNISVIVASARIATP